MILTAAVRSGVGAVCGVLRVAGTAGSHAAWWLDHMLGGSPRYVQDEQRRRSQTR